MECRLLTKKSVKNGNPRLKSKISNIASLPSLPFPSLPLPPPLPSLKPSDPPPSKPQADQVTLSNRLTLVAISSQYRDTRQITIGLDTARSMAAIYGILVRGVFSKGSTRPDAQRCAKTSSEDRNLEDESLEILTHKVDEARNSTKEHSILQITMLVDCWWRGTFPTMALDSM
ncbi:MAG: hypothetical protein Q9192_004686 [Flavoplaca navasiana]